jgi:hypothetical protein
LASFNNIVQEEINPCNYFLLIFQKELGGSKQSNQDYDKEQFGLPAQIGASNHAGRVGSSAYE